VPAAAVAGKPLAVACMSASGSTLSVLVSVLLAATGSGVLEPAVVVMLSEPPAAGAAKVEVQVIDWPTGSGLVVGAHDCVAPPGKPLSAQVGAAAALGPALVQVPVTVIDWPAVADVGSVVAACMSARAATVTGVCAVLFAATGSAVCEPAVPVTVRLPLAGTGYETLQTIALPAGSEAAGTAGAQLTAAPGGRPLAAQVALLAALGPLLVQVSVPVAVLPAAGLGAKPVRAAAMSACGAMVIGFASVLLALLGSAVPEPAFVVIASGPLAGAVKLALQVIAWPTANGFGAGAGVQVCGVPAGRPLSAHVGEAAGLGPALVQTPLTLIVWPAFALAGAVVAACMSACGTTDDEACALLLATFGSVVLVPAAPVIVTPPLAGTV
jgi:hypothetical protein